jgi:uncharacterized membrane protein YdbT with pleckstrin-like domain
VEKAPGEHVIFEGHPSWRSILSFYAKGVLVAVVAGGVAALVTRVGSDEVESGTVAIVVIVVMALVVLIGLIKRIATTYTITNQRLRIRRGVFSRKLQQTRLERVQNVNTRQSVLERILQVGTVDFDTAGTTDADFSFYGVSQPEKVVAAVDQAQREHAAHPAGLGEPHQPAEPSG